MQNKSVKENVGWGSRKAYNDDVDDGDDMKAPENDMSEQWSPYQLFADDAGQGIVHLIMACPHHNDLMAATRLHCTSFPDEMSGWKEYEALWALNAAYTSEDGQFP